MFVANRQATMPAATLTAMTKMRISMLWAREPPSASAT